MKPSEVLETYGWCSGALARNANKGSVDVSSSEAMTFCAVGSIEKAYPKDSDRYAAKQALKKIIGTSIENWNDDPNRTKYQVIDAMKKANL